LVQNGLDMLQVQGPAFTSASAIHVLDNLHRWGTIRPYFVEYYQHVRQVLAACAVLSMMSLWLVPRRGAIVYLWMVLGLHLSL
jgi:hypothetical protein